MAIPPPINQTANLPATVDQNTCCGWISDLMNRLVAILSNFFASVAAFFTGSNQSQVVITPPPTNVPATPSIPGGSAATATRSRPPSVHTPMGPPCVTVEDRAALDRRAAAVRTDLVQNMNADRDHWNQHLDDNRHGAVVSLTRSRNDILPYCAGLRMSQIPYIGHYTTTYEWAMPSLIVKLPRSQLATFPAAIQEKFRALDDSQLDLFLIIGSDSHFADARSRNVVLHPQVHPDIQVGESRHFPAEIGIFDPIGVAHDTNRGVSFGAFNVHDVYPHPDARRMAISPDNARFTIPNNTSMSSFSMASTLPNGRGTAAQVVMLHELTGGTAAGTLNDILNGRYITLRQIMGRMEVEFRPNAPGIHEHINRILTFHETTST